MALNTETFAGANGTAITSLANGCTWTKFGSGNDPDAPQANGSNQLKVGGSDDALYGQNIGNADHFAQVGWSGNAKTSIAPTHGLVVRGTDRNTGVRAYYDDAYNVWRIAGGGGSASVSFAAPTTSTVARLTAQGTTFKLYVDNMATEILSLTHSDASIDTATVAGLQCRSASGNPFFTANYYSGLLSDIGSIGSGSAKAHYLLTGALTGGFLE